MLTSQNINSVLYTGHATLWDFSTGNISSTRPDLWPSDSPDLILEDILQDIGHYSALSLSFNINELELE